ncbi:helix-turn-helix transcriptional regulator [Aquimarina agarilytica]|uniref:helix-turn-helix transcriptional regulator n=1 Tax=Aquimarina agarilytica TaxID=1087449 RepID=UPI00028A2753|nr:AraC family transcriptional regulator [Aquimarina agarilytica]
MIKNSNTLSQNHLDLNELKIHLKGTVTELDDFNVLEIDNTIGAGHVRFYNLQEGVKVYDFDLFLENDLSIPIDCLSTETLQFLYCLDGEFKHQFDTTNNTVAIERFQTAVAHSETGIHSKILIPKNKRLLLHIILVNKAQYFKAFNEDTCDFNEQLKTVLNKIEKQPKYFHAGGYNLKIAEQLKLLVGLEHAHDVSEKLSQKGRYFIILAIQIKQFHQEINKTTNSSGLLKYELAKIFEIGNFIREVPEFQHSIKSLVIESGLSPAKLQEGFRYMYKRTVSDYIRNVRLEKAVLLLKTTDLTISEIVYTIGLTSRSYFCKIFKQKHYCSPKEFRKK